MRLLRDGQRHRRPLSESRRHFGRSIAQEPERGEAKQQSNGQVKDRVPSSNTDIERRASGGPNKEPGG